jgi:hypothetical protein
MCALREHACVLHLLDSKDMLKKKKNFYILQIHLNVNLYIISPRSYRNENLHVSLN